MTPTEQDKELRALLGEMPYFVIDWLELSDDLRNEWKKGGKASDFGGHRTFIQKYEKKLADFITADRKRVALEARIDERSIYISDHINGKNSAFIARVKNAVEHEHSFDRNSLSCKCGVSKIFMVDAADEIAELKSQQEEL